MRARVAMWLYLFFGLMGAYCFPQGNPLANPLASPYSNSVFPAKTFTASGQTSSAIQLNGLIVSSTIGSSFASGTITLTGSSLTTVTFGMQGSSDNGVTYYPLAISSVSNPSSGAVSSGITATGNGLYQVNLAGLTHVRFVTSGTFTATSISLVLTASPNGLVLQSLSGGGGGGGVTSIDSQTGDFTFGGPGVSHVGNSYTFSGSSAGVSSFNTRTGPVTLSAADVNAVGSITNPTSGNAATATALSGTAAANTFYQGPYSGSPAAPGFHPLISSQVTGALGFVPYQTPMLVGNVATGVIADYQFNSGSGTILVDSSGNGNNGTFGAGASAPAWVQGGVGFTGETSQGIQLPSAVNAGKTFVIAAYWTPLSTQPCGLNWPGPGVCPAPELVTNINGFPAWITNNTGSSGLNFISSVDPQGFGQPMIWNGSAKTRANGGFSGFHVIVWVLGTGGGNLDHVYVDGSEVSYSLQGANSGVQTSGNLFLGSSGVSPWTQSSPTAIFYRVRVHSTQYSAADAQAITQVFRADVANRGVSTSPVSPLLGAPQLHCIGDSITAGTALVTVGPYCSTLALTNQPTYTISNWGIPGSKLQNISASEPNRVAQLCQTTTGGPGVAHILAGVNDFISGAAVPATLYTFLQGEVQTLKRGGCKVFVSTLLDFSGTGADAQKNAYNNLIRTGIVASGADGIDDMAADPILGADGAAANTTFFNGGLHPTDAGEAHLTAAMSNTLNYYFGANPANPTIVTASTYSMLSGDAYLVSQPTANQTLTLPNCIGPTGAIYTVNNSQSAFTVGIKNLIAAEPINGVDHSSSALPIPSNSTVRFRIVALPSSTGGCVWNSF